MQPLANQVFTIGQIFSTSLRLWREVAKKVQVLALLEFVWIMLPYFFEPGINTRNPFAWIQHVSERWILSVIYLLVMMVFYVAVFYRTNKVLDAQPSSFMGALGVGLKKLPLLIIGFILCGLSLAVGFVLLLIPGIMMMIIFMVYFPLIIIDNLDPFTAYKRSVQIVLNHWWKTLMVVIIPMAIMVAISLFVEFITQDILVVTHPSGGEIWLANHLLKILLGAIYLPFYAVLISVLLRDLKLRYDRYSAAMNSTITTANV